MNDDPFPMPVILKSGYDAPGCGSPKPLFYRYGAWWIEFDGSLDSDHYHTISQWMRANGCGKFVQPWPNKIRFSEESDWVLFKITFAGDR